MPSPFPGMDPYLESPELWVEFRHQFVAALYQTLLPSLVNRYRSRVSTRQYVVEVPLFTSVQREQYTEELIEICERADGSLVTVVDLVSIANRTTAAGRAAYLQTRRQGELQRASLVEIDLIKQGEGLLDFPRDHLPDHDYTVAVTRPSAPGRYEIYAVPLEKRLPKFRLPLAADDRDTPLDLQEIFRKTYDVSGLSGRIDYTLPPPNASAFTQAKLAWLAGWLVQQKRR